VEPIYEPGHGRTLERLVECCSSTYLFIVVELVAPATYVFTVGSTGDSPVPSGDPPDGTEHGIEGNNAEFSHSSYTTTPPGESPGGAGGSPAPPSVNRYPETSSAAGLSQRDKRYR